MENKNIFLISTDKPSYLYLRNDSKLYISDLFEGGNSAWSNQFIYITNNEDLTLGGYHFNSKYGDEPQKTNQRDIDSRKYWEDEDYVINKIVLTNDKELIADNVQEVSSVFLSFYAENTPDYVEIIREEDGQYVDYLPNGDVVEGIYENYSLDFPKKKLKTEKSIKILEDLDYLFSKINWGQSYLDSKAITIMNNIKSDIKELYKYDNYYCQNDNQCESQCITCFSKSV